MPDIWTVQDELPDLRVTFKAIHDSPLNYTIDASNRPGSDRRNLEVPTIVVAYGREDVVGYACRNYMRPPRIRTSDSLPSVDIIYAALVLIAQRISEKTQLYMNIK